MKTKILFKTISFGDEIPLSDDFDIINYKLDKKSEKLLIEVAHDYGADVVYSFTLFHDKAIYGRRHTEQELRLGISYDNGGNTLEAMATHVLEVPLREIFSQKLIQSLFRDMHATKIIIIKSLTSAVDQTGSEIYDTGFIQNGGMWSAENEN